MLPMLAHRYAQHAHTIQYPCHVQPKLNGIRMLYQNNVCQSRDQHHWHADMLTHIREDLADISPTLVLDGELYRHGWSLQTINSAVAVNRLTPTLKTPEVQYWVFDCLDTLDPTCSFSERHEKLTYAIRYLKNVCLVPTFTVFNPLGLERAFGEFKDQQYEGLMVRDSNSPYGSEFNCGNKENRWKYLLKRKDWLDDEFICTGVEEGEGKYKGIVGSLVFTLVNGRTFTVGSGLSDMERQTYWTNRPIGREFRIKYEMLSDSGIPLKPTIEVLE